MLVVLADDITGAAEIAGVCLRYGITVGFSIDSIPAAETDVHVITTDSRSLPEAEAYEVHAGLARQLSEHFLGVRIFKKCDSALRGHVISELLAIRNNQVTCMVVAANPLTDRCIVDGKYYIGDQLIENTGFATDPDFPATTSDVKRLVCGRSTFLSQDDFVFTGDIPAILQPGFYFPDCKSTEDLKKHAILATRFQLVAGSAVFFEQYLQAVGFRLQVLTPDLPPLPDSYLFVPGSFHPSSRDFRRELHQQGCTVYNFPETLLQANVDEEEVLAWLNFLMMKWDKNPRMGIAIADSKIDFESSQVILKHRLSRIVNKLISSKNILNVYVEGGATAYDIFREAGIHQFRPVTELCPGVVSLLSLDESSVAFTIKPGSYLWPENYFGF